MRDRKRGEEGILSPENEHNEDDTRKPRRQYIYGFTGDSKFSQVAKWQRL